MKLFKIKRKSNVPEQSLPLAEGLIGMKVVSDPSNADLDIVFVHGLTGNRERTWTHENGTFWPQDLLAKDFPNARIMTFGYDVDVFKFTSITSSDRLYDHGQSLAYALVSHRSECSTRPILFIAHSLGGLVCQQAFILSNSIDGLWAISSSAIGIIFMGTPHYGSSLAYYGEKLAKYVNMVHSANREIVGTLNPGSNDLQRVGNEFQTMLRRGDLTLNIFCFYEAKKMNDVVGKIVEEQSAVLRGYENCSINADHSNMTKFKGCEDEGYKLARSVIVRWLQKPAGDATVPEKPPVDDVNSPPPVAGTPAWLQSWTPGNTYFNGPVNGRHVMQGFQANGDQNFAFN
ncbi:hypothetical protein N7457_002943 [Penicillium paradoxum]|uniref:uncharacterized protein n=1 Tax=Penicillium paradoxum TaxID=176176 RepID=UPI002549A306|nr:uncharacterized protein N7457_002943 [Penicillium paradoxum]KAJ5787953.1 hypothetical protein N7457_002943 [Penicillium paradoxum]